MKTSICVEFTPKNPYGQLQALKPLVSCTHIPPFKQWQSFLWDGCGKPLEKVENVNKPRKNTRNIFLTLNFKIFKLKKMRSFIFMQNYLFRKLS